jgi:chorismate dehydratase
MPMQREAKKSEPVVREIRSLSTLRIGCVSFLNSKPLIHGLENEKDVKLFLDVPSALLDGLRHDRYDVALLPVIDYQRMEGLVIVPSGGIGCDGPTLTVRIFSRVPVEKIESLACDVDSHTSVALARVVLAERFGNRPEIVDWKAGEPTSAEAHLVIGDKVICEEPTGFEHQVDLGQAWKELTGRPVVFALWMARRGVDLRDLPQRLERAKRAGMENIETIVDRFAEPRGWPKDIAHKYLCEYLKFDIGSAQLEAIRCFHRMACRHGIIEHAREVELY